MDDSKEDPLKAEAEKREEWRGGGTSLRPDDAPGHTLPESESDGGSDAAPEGGALGTVLPPD